MGQVSLLLLASASSLCCKTTTKCSNRACCSTSGDRPLALTAPTRMQVHAVYGAVC